METNENYWQISEFSKRVNSKYDESLHVHQNTIDKWFKELEERGIHYVQRIDNRKVYDEDDLDIARFILEKRQDSRWKLNGIYDALSEIPDIGRAFPEDYKEPAEQSNGLTKEDVESIVESMLDAKMELFQTKFIEALKTSEKRMNELLPMPINEKNIIDKAVKAAVDQQATIAEKMKQLRQDAIKEWEKKPEAERMIKAGFFKRIEDSSKKESFIESYIEGHL